MTRKLPPHIEQQTYKTRSGYTETRYYIRITDSKGKRRRFPGGPSLQVARQLRDKLLGQNALGFDFDKARQPGPQLFPWIQKYLTLKKAMPVIIACHAQSPERPACLKDRQRLITSSSVMSSKVSKLVSIKKGAASPSQRNSPNA